MITATEVRRLAEFGAGHLPVTSCYLDVDGRRRPGHPGPRHELDELLRRARPRLDGQAQHPSVSADLARIEQYVRGGFERGATRGLALFSCREADWWQVFRLPVAVTSQLAVHTHPCVAQLERIVDDYQRFGLLLVDRQRTRLFVFEAGELIERTEEFEPIARAGADDRGERLKTRRAHQQAAQAHQHLRRAADLAFAVYQRHGFERLAVGAPADLRSELESCLHPYLRARMVGAVGVAPAAPEDQICAAAWDVVERAERQDEAEQVTRLRAQLQAGGRAVAGLGPTLEALGAGRVERLLVSQGYQAEGWRCGCGALATIGRRCPRCGDELIAVADVVEVAVHEALTRHVPVEICVNADLDVLGRIGAVTRY